MKKSILFFAAFAALVSCVKENPVTENQSDETPAVETVSITLQASAPTASADTKTTLVNGEGDSKLVHWSNGDQIKVLFFPRTASTSYVENNVTTGATGILTATFDGETASESYFSIPEWNWSDGINYMNVGIALYPSTVVATSVKPSDGGQYAALTNDIHYELPAEQTAIENSFASNLNFAYAEISDKSAFAANQAKLSFKNGCALIRITLPDVENITSVKVESANGSLAGTYAVDTYENSYYKHYPVYPLSMSATDGCSAVTLSAPAGETLKANGVYYMVVWPGTHSGLTFTFTNSEDKVAIKTITDEVTFAAAKYNAYKVSSLNFIEKEETIGNYYFADGTTGDDPTAGEVIGVVFYKGDPSVAMNDTDLSGKYTNGLVISLNDITTTWGGSSQLSGFPSSVCLTYAGPTTYATGGYTTKNIWTGSGFNLPIYNTGSNVSNTSGWYIPAVVEWKYIYEKLSTINNYIEVAAGTEIVISSSNSEWYWLPLIYNFSSYSYPPFMVGLNGSSLSFQKYGQHWHWGSTAKSRPIFAF